jgi:hypothetical protein
VEDNSGCLRFGMKAAHKEPRCSIQRGSF